LMNVGPKADGTIPQESIDLLKQVGAWMKVNSEAIYDTKASPFGLFSWGRCTKKESNGKTTLYFSVFEWPKDGKLTIPNLKNEIVSSKLLANGKSVKGELTKDGAVFNLPANAIDTVATVLKVEVKGNIQVDLANAKAP
jgi:alpha-L-fucosidase